VAEEPIQKRVRLVWVGAEDMPVVFTNQALGQVGSHGEILLTFGQSSPPVFVPESDEETARVLEGISELPIKPVARLALTRISLEQLIVALQTTLKNYDRVQQFQAEAKPEAEEGQSNGT
jgi:hypothetical protein